MTPVADKYAKILPLKTIVARVAICNQFKLELAANEAHRRGMIYDVWSAFCSHKTVRARLF